MTAAEFPTAAWVKSSLSLANGNCVEVAALPGMILVRDSKRGPGSPVIAVTPDASRTFSGSLKACIARFFDGLELIPPGIPDVAAWRASVSPALPSWTILLGGVGKTL